MVVDTLDNVHVEDNPEVLVVVVEDLVVDFVVYIRHLVVAGMEHSLAVEEEHFPVADQVVQVVVVLVVHQMEAYAAAVVDNFALAVVVHLQFVEVPWHLVAEFKIHFFLTYKN